MRSLIDNARFTELKYTISKLNWHIIGLSEVKLEGKEIIEEKEFIFIYYGQKRNRNGIGFLIKKELKNNLIDFIPISDRVARLVLQFGYKIIHIIQVYAPTEKASPEDIATFYKDIRQAMKNTNKDTFVIGDFNAQIGIPTIEDKYVMGSWGYGKRSPRGKTLIDFCFEHQLHIANTYFKKNISSKWTWLHPDGVTRNEIDFIIARNNNSIHNIEVLSTLYPTDHRMVRASVLLNYKRITSRKHFGKKIITGITNIEKEFLKSEFRKEINKFEFTDIESTYSTLITKIQKCCEKLPKKSRRKILIQENIIKLIKERTVLKEKKKKTHIEKKRLSALYKLIKKQIKYKLTEQRYKIIEEEIEKRASVKKSLQTARL